MQNSKRYNKYQCPDCTGRLRHLMWLCLYTYSWTPSWSRAVSDYDESVLPSEAIGKAIKMSSPVYKRQELFNRYPRQAGKPLRMLTKDDISYLSTDTQDALLKQYREIYDDIDEEDIMMQWIHTKATPLFGVRGEGATDRVKDEMKCHAAFNLHADFQNLNLNRVAHYSQSIYKVPVTEVVYESDAAKGQQRVFIMGDNEDDAIVHFESKPSKSSACVIQ